MRRAAFMGCNPYLKNSYKKSTKQLFEETGGNTGNLAFQFAVAQHLGGNPPIAHWGMTPDELRKQADIIVLPLANQLGKHTNLGTAADRLDHFNLPVIGLGLGAQALSDKDNIVLSEGTERWLKTLARLRPAGDPNIGLRGEYTRRQCERYIPGDVVTVMGCPSNFINTDPALGEQLGMRFLQKRSFVAVNGGIPHLPNLRTLEILLAKFVTGAGSAYIVQHGLEMLQLSRQEFSEMKEGAFQLCNQYVAPQLDEDAFKRWCQRFAISFYDAQAWMDYIRRFDFVIGTRFHGAMLALQAGVPAGCISHDSRTYEMCVTMGVPVLDFAALPKDVTAQDLINTFTFDANDYNLKRVTLLDAYLKVFAGADIQPAADLRKLYASLRA